MFVDLDYVDVCRSGDLIRFAQAPFAGDVEAAHWEVAMRPLGVAVASLRCQKVGLSAGALSLALKVANDSACNVLSADIAGLLASGVGDYDEAQVYIKEVVLESLSLEGGTDLSGVEFQDCLISQLDLAGESTSETLPVFRRCHFALVTGRTGPSELPGANFLECEVGEFELASRTTQALLALPLPLTCRVMLTALKKLYLQKGAGRKDGALARGLDPKARNSLAAAMELLRREGFAIRTKQGTEVVWLPAKGADFRHRALTILGGPIASVDPLMAAAKALT